MTGSTWHRARSTSHVLSTLHRSTVARSTFRLFDATENRDSLRDGGLPRLAVAARRHAAGADGVRGGALHRAGGLRGLPDRLPPAGAVLVRGGLRAADAVMPRNVQKDEEASLTWTLKDENVRRGKSITPSSRAGRRCSWRRGWCRGSNAIWGVRRDEEKRRLSRQARPSCACCCGNGRRAPATCVPTPATDATPSPARWTSSSRPCS